MSETNIKYLQRIWQNEKFSKEILQFEDKVLDILKKIESKEEELNTLKANEDSELIELDIERIKFIIKDYLRIRMAKIEKYLYYIVKHDLTALLSSPEFEYVMQLFKLKKKYFDDGIYRNISGKLNDFKVDGTIGDNIIVQADENSYVVMKSISEEPILVNLKEIYEESLETKTINKDDVFCLPLKLIK